MNSYTEQPCYSCGTPHPVPNWFKPFKEYCDDCRLEQIERFADLDKEDDVEETQENEQ